VTAAPFKLKMGLQAENAVLRHYLIFAAGSLIASGLPTMIAGSLSCFTAGFRLQNHPSRDAPPLVPLWLSPLLALEVTVFGRPPQIKSGAAGDDPSRELMCRAVEALADRWRWLRRPAIGFDLDRP
jgi:hypothetical protein